MSTIQYAVMPVGWPWPEYTLEQALAVARARANATGTSQQVVAVREISHIVAPVAVYDMPDLTEITDEVRLPEGWQ